MLSVPGTTVPFVRSFEVAGKRRDDGGQPGRDFFLVGS